jgi:hypothetical protein
MQQNGLKLRAKFGFLLPPRRGFLHYIDNPPQGGKRFWDSRKHVMRSPSGQQNFKGDSACARH